MPAELAELLVLERLAAADRIEQARSDLEAIVAAAETSNGDDEHDPEGPTVAYERARVDALRRSAEADLAEIEAALGRLRDGRFGRCEGCGESIGAERLAARPSTRLCVQCSVPPAPLHRPGRVAPRRRDGSD